MQHSGPSMRHTPCESPSWKDTRIPVCTARFTAARTRTQPRRPLADGQMKQLRYGCTVDYYSAIKMNTTESALMRWMNLEPHTE